MSALAFSFTDTLKPLHCSECGIHYAFPESFTAQRREDHKTFYCPNGHMQHFVGKSEADKLRDELTREKQRREMAEREAAMEARRAANAEKAHARDKKRTQHGVCTCCNRTFQNLARHMATKHKAQP